MWPFSINSGKRPFFHQNIVFVAALSPKGEKARFFPEINLLKNIGNLEKGKYLTNSFYFSKEIDFSI